MPKLFLRSKKYSHIEISKFFRELSLMLDSGLSLFNAVKVSGKNWEFCSGIIDSISLGNPLSASLLNLSFEVDKIAVDFIKVSEQMGDLSGGLRRASAFLENKDTFRKKMISALSYPMFVVALSFAALLVLVSVLIPSFEGIYSGMGIQLPFISRVVMGFGKFIIGYFHVISIFILCSCFSLYKYSRTVKGARLIDNILLKLPFIGGLRREMIYSRFFDNLFQAIKAGISVPDSMYMAGNVLSSPVYREQIADSLSLVKSGNSLSVVLDKKLFPSIALNLIAVGESTAKLDLVFEELKKYFEEVVERKIRTFSGLIEPISTLVVGAVVGIIVLAMFMPMIDLVGSMSF